MRSIKLHSSGYMLLQQLSAVRYTVIWCVVTGTHCMFSAICKTILHLTTLYRGRSQPLELLNSYSMLKFIVTRAKAIPNSACYQYQMQTYFTCNVGVPPFFHIVEGTCYTLPRIKSCRSSPIWSYKYLQLYDSCLWLTIRLLLQE